MHAAVLSASDLPQVSLSPSGLSPSGVSPRGSHWMRATPAGIGAATGAATAMVLRRGTARDRAAAMVAQALELPRQRLADCSFSSDLTRDIGSAPWWRGAGLMLGLSLAALACWPGLVLPTAPLPPAGHALVRVALPEPMDADSEGPLAALPARPAVAVAVSTLVTTLAQGDDVAVMLRRVGVRPRDAGQVSALLCAALPAEAIAPGTRFDVAVAAGDGRTLQRLDFHTASQLAVRIERRGDSLELSSGGGSLAGVLPLAAQLPVADPGPVAPPTAVALASAPAPIRVDTTPLRIRGPVGDSLYHSARAAGVPARAVQQYLQAISAHMDIAELRPTDTFDLILANRRTSAGAEQTGELLYAGLEQNGHRREALLRWGPGGQFMDAATTTARRAVQLVMPVDGRITSGFGMRYHPILGYTRMHAGVDLSAPYGSPIYAVASGTVEFAGTHGGLGRFVRLEHSGGIGSGYGHMSRIAVAEGAHVRAGQVIGYVGSSGLSTGAHLHYEVYRAGQTVNPLSLRSIPGEGGAGLPAGDLPAFRARLARLMLIAPSPVLPSSPPRIALR